MPVLQKESFCMTTGQERQLQLLIGAAEFVGTQTACLVQKFAQDRGLEIMKYDPLLDTWHLSDGEPIAHT